MNIRVVVSCLLIILAHPLHAIRFSPNKDLLPNKTYVISKNIDLKNNTIIIPESCTLKFKRNGRLENGTIVGQDTRIIAPLSVIFGEDIKFKGSFSCAIEYEWLYDSVCTIKKKKVNIKDNDYIVSEAVGTNQWDNFLNVFPRIVGSFKELHFNKSYVLNNPNGDTSTKHNMCVISARVEDLKICGGIIYNAGICFLNWYNLEISNITILGRYHNYDRFVTSMTWDEMYRDQGELLCFNNVGICLSSPSSKPTVNSCAVLKNIHVDGAYNGIYIGRWDGEGREVSTVSNVIVSDCVVNHTIYHAYASCNCENVTFINNKGANSYLGMFIDISRGSINVKCEGGEGRNFSQPFKIANNLNYAPTKNCSLTNNIIEVSEILSGFKSGRDIIISGCGTHVISGNQINYNSSVSTLFTLTDYTDLNLQVKENYISGYLPNVFFRVLVTNKYQNVKISAEVLQNVITGFFETDNTYFVLVDEQRTDTVYNHSFDLSINKNIFNTNDSKQIINVMRSQGKCPGSLYGSIKYSDNYYGPNVTIVSTDYLQMGNNLILEY